MTSEGVFLSRILVVDDAPENVKLLTRILQRNGYTEVTGTTDPRTVLERVKTDAPALVIVDIHMPSMDGFTVVRQLSAMVERPPKVLLVTGDVDVGPQAVAAGVDGVLIKPFLMEEVLSRVRALLEDSPGSRP